MKKLYEKSELAFALVCIAAYCVLQSLANPLNRIIDIQYSASAILCVLCAPLVVYQAERPVPAVWAL